MGTRVLVLLALSGAASASGQRVGTPTDDLTNLSVDDLFRVEVTSVGRKAQELSKAPAAVFVLTADDIRRSGATSIPEALQWVPGMTVSSIDGRSWAISARGDASLYADKMLVMIDGRSLYTPLFAGVIWDAIDVPLEDIDRIEVVRGPGAVMWGPNAMNGVINIITKSAHATKGYELSVASGNELHGSLMARWGAEPNEHFAFRLWTKLDDSNPAFGSPGYYDLNAGNAFKDPRPADDLTAITARMGFRIDAEPSAKDNLLFAGDLYEMQRRDMVAYPVVIPSIFDTLYDRTQYGGGFFQARWTHSASEGNESTLQFTFDRNVLDYPFIGGDLNNLTVNYEKRLQTSERNEVYWGAGFQQYWDSTQGQRFVSFNPADSVYRVSDVVLRDEFQLIPDRLVASAGIRVDYSTYTHFEFQPSFRLLYTPTKQQSLWFAVSRAARIPSRFERGMVSDSGESSMAGIPLKLGEYGSTAIQSETERSIEMGYRLQHGQRWSFDTSIFWSYYGKLRGLAYSIPADIVFKDGALFLPLTETSAGTGRSWGAETSATWQILPRWRLIPSYSYLNEVRWFPNSPPVSYTSDFALSAPRHQAFIRSQHDLSRKWQLDLMARARSRNSGLNLPGYLFTDVRLGWRATRDTEFSISVQNLADKRVLEAYSEVPFVAIPTRRTYVFRWIFRF